MTVADGRAVEVRRDASLAATVEVLDRGGLAATRVADVAAELGVSPSLVFYHFGTKDDLVAEAFAYAVEHRPGLHPLQPPGPRPLLRESRANPVAKLLFQSVYWHALLPGRDIPGISSQFHTPTIREHA